MFATYLVPLPDASTANPAAGGTSNSASTVSVPSGLIFQISPELPPAKPGIPRLTYMLPVLSMAIPSGSSRLAASNDFTTSISPLALAWLQAAMIAPGRSVRSRYRNILFFCTFYLSPLIFYVSPSFSSIRGSWSNSLSMFMCVRTHFSPILPFWSEHAFCE